MSNRYKKNQNQSPIFTLFEKGIVALVDKLFHKGPVQVFPKGEITRLWENVESLDSTLAIIEADKLVDTVLKRMGFNGDSMGERLRSSEKLVPRNVYNDMWEAHKVRNQLVHEIDHHYNAGNAGETLLKMKRYLIALGVFRNE